MRVSAKGVVRFFWLCCSRRFYFWIGERYLYVRLFFILLKAGRHGRFCVKLESCTVVTSDGVCINDWAASQTTNQLKLPIPVQYGYCDRLVT